MLFGVLLQGVDVGEGGRSDECVVIGAEVIHRLGAGAPGVVGDLHVLLHDVNIDLLLGRIALGSLVHDPFLINGFAGNSLEISLSGK